MNFSVLTSLYKSNTPVEVRDCFRSISLQTILPTEVVVIIDGPISQDLINEIKKELTVTPHLAFKHKNLKPSPFKVYQEGENHISVPKFYNCITP